MVKVIWTNTAKLHLRNIYLYYKNEKKSLQTAFKIRDKLYATAEILATFPQAGPIEPLLSTERNEEFRSFVADRNHKLIYQIDKEIVHIIAVWDCRNSPKSLKEAVFYDDNDIGSAPTTLHEPQLQPYGEDFRNSKR